VSRSAGHDGVRAFDGDVVGQAAGSSHHRRHAAVDEDRLTVHVADAVDASQTVGFTPLAPIGAQVAFGGGWSGGPGGLDGADGDDLP
jgi:hypothetical protein